jgi:hypothetical protein
MTEAERERVLAAVRNAAYHLLASGQQGTDVVVPELGETWTISREEN